MTKQTIILILTSVIVLGIIGVGVYFWMNSLPKSSAGPGEGTPSEGEEAGGKVAEEPAGPEVAEKGELAGPEEGEGETVEPQAPQWQESEESVARPEEEIPSGGEGIADGEIEKGEPAEPETPQWQEPEEPEESAPLEESEVPTEAIKITMTALGINPSSFEVEGGAKIVLSITSGDEWTHVFKFKDESLKDAVVGVAPGETRAITFYAPSEAGEYEYYCDLPGHASRGETGKMIVK